MVGRIAEKKYLQSLLDDEEPQFIAVFGRRRIGKTYLVRESFNHHFTFQHTGLSNVSIKPSSQKQMQLDKFSESLADAGYRSDKKLTSWNEAFNALKEVIIRSKEKKKVVFIDELSWMDTKDSGLISALESFWNSFVTAREEKDVILIVCASATYWMVENIVNSKGGLHNRLTGRINLLPFTLKECAEYIASRNISLSPHQILQCYMIMGGVPYYWSLLKKGKSLAKNIDELFFADGAPLQNEYNNLYSALFNKPDQYIKIVEALGSVKKGITRDEICKKTGISSSGDFSKKLRELEYSGFIQKIVQFGYRQNKCLYQLMDNYTLFYYKFIRNKSFDKDYWKSQSNSSSVRAWCGLAFERVCLEHIDQIKASLGISGVQTDVNTWQCDANADAGVFGSQIDLLIVRKDQIINLCEMKFSEAEFIIDSSFHKELKEKISDLVNVTKTKYAIHPTLVTTYGIKNNSYSDDIQAIITTDDLFR